MIRTVVHSAPIRPEGAEDGDAHNKDEYSDKLLKYIPAEVIAFYLPMYTYALSFVQQGDGPVTDKTPLIVVLLVSLLGLVGYMYVRRDPKTNWYFYVLSAVAFLCWAVGTSSVAQAIIDLPELYNKVILMTGIFLIPMFDELLTSQTADAG